MKLIRAQPSAMEEWHRFCTFWPQHFSPSFNLHLFATPMGGAARRIRHPEQTTDIDWLRPLLPLARRIQLWLQIPSGDSGTYYGDAATRKAKRKQQKEMMSAVIDVTGMVRPEDRAEEDVIADLQRQVQDALWEWKPYGRLIGGD
jgi:hypothetical protein